MWWAFACVAPEDGAVDVAFLGDVSELPERTRVATHGPAWLDDDHPLDEPTEAGGDGRALVVVDPDDRVRVQYADDAVELLLWLDRADLVDVTAARTWSRGASSETGAEFPAGLAVDWDGRTPIATVEGVWLTARRALPPGAVDQVYVPEPAPAPVTADGYLRGGAVLRDVPGGDTLATVREIDGFLVPAAVHRREGDDVLVEAVDGDLRVVGWVDADALAASPTAGVGWCGGCCGGFGRMGWGFSGPTVDLPPGTLLWSDDAIVGRVRATWTVPGELVDGRITASRWTPWGQATVVATPGIAWVPEGSDDEPA